MNVFLVLDVSRFMLLLLCCDYEGEREPKPAVFVDLRLRTSILRLRPRGQLFGGGHRPMARANHHVASHATRVVK